MSPHPDENGPEPDDRHLVRPYVAGPQDPYGPAYPAWPTLPESLEETTQPLPLVPPAPPAGPAAADHRHAPGRRGSRLAPAALALLALAGAGALVFLLSGPEPQARPASARPDLDLPALPARSPGAGETEIRNQAATVKPSASATRSPSAPPSPSKPASGSPTPSGKPGKQPGSSGTLRPGDKGPEVRVLQERLYGQGFTYVKVTGVYDGQTKRGVAQLQRDRDIKGDPSGVYGPATRAAFG
ncbi:MULTISPECIES: peptidoglycan-binding domain-containing protein [Streptomyces]|uniref:peptidoglycan-binding domain-containing protein n=1 Tax=Streptomyces TaxID=1883 RepID=UPI000F70C175|nr:MULTISPECIES: peptidoglycan-binding domain-containing protein [unclassified Streptomyces]AZM87704.1 peptidoglycan-binding protein [Streptomyces sp. W1SF4]RSS50725.1 peptidoglycan-binding protein [Streptomyces sp. WAC07061]